MNKTAIKNFAIQARNKLIADVCYRAGLVGITEKGIQAALPQSDSTTEFYDIGIATPYDVSGQAAIRQRRNLAEALRQRAAVSDYPTAYRYIMEEVAYTWFNRLIAVRFMEVNDYLPGRVRVLSSESGKIEPDLVTTPFDAGLNFTAEEEQAVLQLKQDNKLDELFRLLFIKQCNALAAVLPALFEQHDDYTELLLNLSVVDQDGVVWRLTHDIPEDDFNVEKGGQVEIIGWLYQYYNTEPKAQVFARPSGQKIKKEEIPAATQLFTPDWIVRYMVENSLGRLWLEGHPDEELRAGWKYYLDEAEQKPDVAAQLEELRAERRSLTPEDIKVIDPCMGSGHILVYAFDVLMQIYEKAGWERREAARSIVERNLYGLDIDKRAYQLAYFAVMMKARQYDRRFLTREIAPQVYHPGADKELEEFGSLLIVENWDKPENSQISLQDIADNYRRLLARKYDVVCSNPPYMGNMPAKLTEYVRRYYPEEKYDLYAAFVKKCTGLSAQNGYVAMITQQAWMFLSSFEKFRYNLNNSFFINAIHLGARAFEEIGGEVVQTVAFVLCNYANIFYKGSYKDLTSAFSQKEKEQCFFDTTNFNASQNGFHQIPGGVYAYWLSNAAISLFTSKKLADYVEIKSGIVTGNNDYFLRFWYEINIRNVGFNHKKFIDSSTIKWVPMHKGGGYKKHYGLHEHIMNLHDIWEPSKANISIRRGDTKYYFNEGLTWSTLSNNLSVRRSPTGFVFDTKGSMCFPRNISDLAYIEAFLNSKVAAFYMAVLSPTLDFNQGAMAKVPFVHANHASKKITVLSDACVNIAKADWDSFETSWDFTHHPLVTYAALSPEQIRREENSGFLVMNNLADVYKRWEQVCNDRFQQLKANEEGLNRIFIDIYGLQEELTPEVEDKDVTVRRADLGRDIRSLLSYAVGCMFGRYSLDEPGLILAGYDKIEYETKTLDGDSSELEKFARKNPDGSVSYGSYYRWVDQKRFKSFPIDADNILPLTDESYLEDDIISRLCQWLRAVYGPDTLEENLDFIAKALGNKGSTSREVIRNYFLKDFFADHCKIYQKRPIYWLFDSGKQNGFKALVYLHRYTPDTIGKLRVDYLHRLQRVYASEIERMQDMIDNSKNPREVTASTKRKEKLQKQLKECREYDEKIAHLALARIELDLDDGVKVNYRKVQTAADGKFYEVLADSKNIMGKK